MPFHKGQEIVCVINWQKYVSQLPVELHPYVPVQWEVYHCGGYSPDIGEVKYIFLAEFPEWACYAEEGFRPVQKTSMDMLRSLQAPTPTPVKVPEDA